MLRAFCHAQVVLATLYQADCKQEGEITAIEIKSSMTYHASFEKTLRQLTNWIKTPVVKRAVVYGGDFENTQSEVNLLNYNNLHKLLHA